MIYDMYDELLYIYLLYFGIEFHKIGYDLTKLQQLAWVINRKLVATCHVFIYNPGNPTYTPAHTRIYQPLVRNKSR